MGQVVFDVLDGAGKGRPGSALNSSAMPATCWRLRSRLKQQPRARPVRRDIGELAEKVGAAAAVDGDVGHVAQIGLGLA